MHFQETFVASFFSVKMNYTMFTCVSCCISKYASAYNATFLQDISDLFKTVITLRKINVSELMIKLLLDHSISTHFYCFKNVIISLN